MQVVYSCRMNERSCTLVIADDHPLFRTALHATVLRSLPRARIIEAESLPALRAVFGAEVGVDLVLLDLRMPGVQGLSSLMELRAEHPAVPVIIVSGIEEQATILRVRQFGAAGFIPKSAPAEAIALAIQTVLDGGTWFPAVPPGAAAGADPDGDLVRRLASLTPQQLRVLTRLGAGRLNKQIASDLEVTEATVKAHMTAILRKLGIYRRTQAALLAQRLTRDDGAPLWTEELAAAAASPEPDAQD